MALFKGKNEFLCPLRYLPHKKHKNEKMNQLSIISTKWVAYLRKITLQKYYNLVLLEVLLKIYFACLFCGKVIDDSYQRNCFSNVSFAD